MLEKLAVLGLHIEEVIYPDPHIFCALDHVEEL
jgi:hypothetical protein